MNENEKSIDKVSWIKRRWYDFRNGHSTYLIFIVQFAQFIVVTYGLYIENTEVLKMYIPTIYHWIGIFLITYLPAAILVGHFHLTKQMPSDAKQQVEKYPFTYQIVPGKEVLTTKVARVNYDIQLKSMKLHNQIASTLNTNFKSKIGIWDENDFAKVLENQRVTKLIEEGFDTRDIQFKEYKQE